jgi:hypothetical protein
LVVRCTRRVLSSSSKYTRLFSQWLSMLCVNFGIPGGRPRRFSFLGRSMQTSAPIADSSTLPADSINGDKVCVRFNCGTWLNAQMDRTKVQLVRMQNCCHLSPTDGHAVIDPTAMPVGRAGPIRVNHWIPPSKMKARLSRLLFLRGSSLGQVTGRRLSLGGGKSAISTAGTAPTREA